MKLNLFKTLTFLSMFLFTNLLSAQTEIKFEDLNGLTSKPKASELKKYIASNGEVFEIGGNVNFNEPSGKSNTYQYITKQVLTEVYPVDTYSNNEEVKILKFRIVGTKRSGFKVFLITNSKDGAWRYIVDTEQSLIANEIKSNILSREEAIAKLKEAKDLLDLEMMSQEDYDKIKAELTPIIMGKN